MSVLLLRIQAPLQSWGISSNFTIRDSTKEPSKSGIIGLLCAALGRPRNADITDLTRLELGIRVDREGVLQKDYQIAQNVFQAKGKGLKESEPSTRYYLADAVFLVGLKGEYALLLQLYNALQNPRWQLYFGRKAFVPSAPIWLSDGLSKSNDLLAVLQTYPPLIETDQPQYRMIMEDVQGEYVRSDVPLSFSERLFSSRRIHIFYILPPEKKEKEGR